MEDIDIIIRDEKVSRTEAWRRFDARNPELTRAASVTNTARNSPPSIEGLLVEAQKLAAKDPTLSKEQHSARLLRENPQAYDAYLNQQAARREVGAV